MNHFLSLAMDYSYSNSYGTTGIPRLGVALSWRRTQLLLLAVAIAVAAEAAAAAVVVVVVVFKWLLLLFFTYRHRRLY